MYSLHLKDMAHRMHLSAGHGEHLMHDHLTYDEHFWAVIRALALIAILIILGTWARQAGGTI